MCVASALQNIYLFLSIHVLTCYEFYIKIHFVCTATSCTRALQSFFSRWWEDQSDHVRDAVKKLVADGQLEFVNGGFVQHDEAAAHFVAMIDQTTRGHRHGMVPSTNPAVCDCVCML